MTLQSILRLSGKVMDATTGRPIENLTAIPVAHSGPARLFVERQRKKTFSGGTFEITGDRTDEPTACDRVRRIPLGHERGRSRRSPAPMLDFRLEPAAPLRGQVIDTRGRPVKRAGLPGHDFTNARHRAGGRERLAVQPDGPHRRARMFSFPAQFEEYTLVAIHDDGYAELNCEPNQQPGELTLKAWAKVEGRLLKAGQPVPSVWIFFMPIRLEIHGVSPHIQDAFSVKTDRDGRFVFPRVAPMKSRVNADHSGCASCPGLPAGPSRWTSSPGSASNLTCLARGRPSRAGSL